MSKCIGCGITLQNNSRDLPGYVNNLDYQYCERCFRNIHYSEVKDESLNITNKEIINKINQSSDLTFFIVDLFNLSSEVINLFKSITSNKYLVINKMDVIPKDIKEIKITKLLNDIYDIKDNTIFTSVKINNIPKYFNNKNIYFCGITNSGKTSLISNITGNKEITKSSMVNTTLDYINIPYDNYNIVDCPGFVINTNEIDNKYLKLVNPSKKLKIRNYNLKENTTLNIHDLLKISFIDKNNVSCYLSNGLIIKKDYKELEEYEEFIVDKDSDLIILGYGFLNIKDKGIIRIPSSLKYEIRKSIF